MEKRRLMLARIMLGLDVLVCAVWIYWSLSSMRRMLSGTGSGAIAGVGTGVDLFLTVLPPVITIDLTRAAGSTRLARYWRNAHLIVTLAMIIVPLMGGLSLMMLSIAVFQPVQVLFVIGAFAIWFGSPRRQSLVRES
jgi:hypothetical protein